MATSPEINAFDRGVTPIIQIVLPEREQKVLDFKPDPSLQERIDALACKSTEGELTDDERAEYAGYVWANKFVAILRRQAERLLAQSAGDQ